MSTTSDLYQRALEAIYQRKSHRERTREEYRLALLRMLRAIEEASHDRG